MKTQTKRLVLAALMAALIAICALVVIPIGPVPFSMAFFGVMFAGAMLTPGWAIASLSVYMALGLVGLPIFSGMQGGPQQLVGPTGGYLVGYYVLIVCVSVSVRLTQNFVLQLLGAVVGIAGCYLLGTLWFVFITGNSFATGLALCVAPFVLPDVLKAAAALTAARGLTRRINAQGAWI